MDRFKNKYRIASARAQWWNYGWNGAYFITICTQNREHFFGEIVGGKINLSNTGVIADIFWHEIPTHAPFVELGDFMVMPSHIHGILILDKPDRGNGTDADVETLHATSLRKQRQPQSPDPDHPSVKNEQMAAIPPKPNTISIIIRSYKSAVSKHATRLNLPNGWQTRYHDHIIRDDAEYQRISDYIIQNLSRWQDDKFYTT